MKRFITICAILVIALILQGCAVYSSANMARIHSDNVTVLGPWGWVHTGANSDITFYTGRQSASKDALKKDGKIDWPSPITIQADSNSNLNIGKPAKNLPTAKVVVPEESQSGIIDAVSKVISK
jgi:hypothetical protein